MISITTTNRLGALGKLTVSHFNAVMGNAAAVMGALSLLFYPAYVTANTLLTQDHMNVLHGAFVAASDYLGLSINTNLRNYLWSPDRAVTSDLYDLYAQTIYQAGVTLNASDVTVYAGEYWTGEITL